MGADQPGTRTRTPWCRASPASSDRRATFRTNRCAAPSASALRTRGSRSVELVSQRSACGWAVRHADSTQTPSRDGSELDLAALLAPCFALSWCGSLADQLLARVGTMFILDATRKVVWANANGREWLAATVGAPERLARATRAGDPLLQAMPLGNSAGHQVVFVQDAARELEERLRVAKDNWGLTPTQRNVLRGIVRGLANKEIAAELGNAEATIEVHVTRVLRKAREQSRTALISHFWGGAR